MNPRTKNPTPSAPSSAGNKASAKKLAKVGLQFTITIGALWLVLAKTDVHQILTLMRNANGMYLFLALIFFNISKVYNAIRLKHFFKAIGLDLSWLYNLKLYYLGMFYNLFLPGGVGGDGYKIFVLQKNYGVKTMNVFNAVFWDRVCGIFALAFLALALMLPSSFSASMPEAVPLAWAGLIGLYPASWILNRLLYPRFLDLFAITAWESMLIQLAQMASAFFILKALSVESHQLDYLAIFLVSSVATILPITVGGAGAREVTFYYLLDYLGLDTSTGIALSLIFFAISAISSLAGILSRIRHESANQQLA